MEIRKKRILVVEDEAIIACQIQHLLEDAGWEVLPELYFTTAMLLASNIEFDFATLTIRMSDTQTSLPIAEILQTRGIPYVFLTSYTEEDARRRVTDPDAQILFKTEMSTKLVNHIRSHIG